MGSDYMHIAIDDHSRFAYVEALPDERGPTAADFLVRAVLAFAQSGITVERVLTDNGGCYRFLGFLKTASELGVQLRRTRPFRPQTNGKAEAFNKTLQREWAYRRVYLSNAERLGSILGDLHARLQLRSAAHKHRQPAAGLSPCKQRPWELHLGRGCGAPPENNEAFGETEQTNA